MLDELAAVERVLTWRKNPNLSLRDSYQELERLNEVLIDLAVEGLGRGFPPLMIANQYLCGLPEKYTTMRDGLISTSQMSRNQIIAAVEAKEERDSRRGNKSIECWNCGGSTEVPSATASTI